MDPSLDHHEYCTGGFSPDDIVISGIAGRFPQCNNVGELKEALLAKKTLLIATDERFEKGADGCPIRISGIINNIDKFDSEFFGIPYSLNKDMDPAMKKNIEVSYEAIADSGYDPHSLKGLNIGVYNATSNEDAAKLVKMKRNYAAGYLRCMNANRISFIYDFHGPSLTVDTACSSTAIAICIAYHDLLEGRVDAAVINSCQLCLDPKQNNYYLKSGIISESGISAPFDASASGMVRSEAAGGLFLQKASVARRAYATILTIKQMAAGFVPEGVYVPSFQKEVILFKNTLRDSGVSPQDVDFIETHGTGTTVGDPIELNAIAEAFCKERKKPLYLGSIKSNIGHSEAAAALCGIIKCVVAFEHEVILPNYSFNTPNPKSPALVKGDLKIVTEPMPFTGNIIPVNSFGFGGAIVSAILKKNPIEYSKEQVSQIIPRLVLYPATTEAAVNFVFEYIKNASNLQPEFFTLLNKLAFTTTLLKPFRGYAVFPNHGDPVLQIKNSLSDKRQVWFIMTGMGCQWPGMGLQLMEIDVFAQSMKKSAEVLKPLGINLFEILRADKNFLQIHRSITPAFVSIAAIQIAFVDLLRAVEIYPDGIIGHSTGELVCAYADGCCTAEETILSAYWRGVAVENGNIPYCEMAAIGMSWEEAKHRCPENVYPACHNADDSVTISGLKEPVEKFVAQLKRDNVFARIVNAYGYGFHSKFMHPVAGNLRSALQKLLSNPKPRSKCWISSSYPEDEWETENCKMAGPEYFVHNLMSVVLFNDAVKKIPSDAITIEIGPHALLQAILKRAIGPKASYFSLMKRNEENNINYIFESLGKLYAEGLNPNIEKLYPPVKFPVPRTTPTISDILKWDYSQTWYVPKWEPKSSSFYHTFHLDGDDSYLLDHCIQGRSLFPATGYIYLAWLALAKNVKKEFDEVPVLIENFKIHKATILGRSEKVVFSVTILNMGGDFEITERNSLVASGTITHHQSISFSEPLPVYIHEDHSNAVPGEDIYDELKISGYQYGPFFRGLTEVNLDGTQGLVSWDDKWITFMDSLLLFFGLIQNSKTFQLPTGAHSIKICPKTLKDSFDNYKDKKLLGLPVSFNPSTNRCRCSGIEITKLILDPAPQSLQSDTPMLEQYKFVPYVGCCNSSDISNEHLSYMSACNDIIEKIGKNLKRDLKHAKFSLNSNKCFEDFKLDMKQLSVEDRLLATLNEIAELGCINNIIKQSKELFLSYIQNVGKDILNGILINECYLRIMFDIISENSCRKLSVLEINKDCSIFLPYVTEIVEKYTDLKFKNKILISNTAVDDDLINKNEIQFHLYNKISNLSLEKSQNVVISSFCCGTYEELKDHIHLLSSVLNKNGFILLYHKREIFAPEAFLSSLCNETFHVISDSALEETFQSENLIVISKVSDYLGGSLYLLRNPVPLTSHKVLYVRENEYDWVEKLKSCLYNNSSSDRVWIISEDNAVSGIIGLVNCLRHEPGGERIRCVFMADSNKNSKLPPFNPEDPFYWDIFKRDLLMNVLKNNIWGSFRHIMIENRKQVRELENSFVVCNRFGDLSSFQWMESVVKYQKVLKDDVVHVYYSALNFKDVMIAAGKLAIAPDKGLLNETSLLGFEFSGRKSSGQRIAGICSRAISTLTVKHPCLYFDVPDHWSLEEAATVPVVYITCFYALLIRGNLQHGESILIQSGTGGIGLAAINIALSLHCNIFVTVGTEEKRNYLRKLFPQIKSENIGCSRNTSFEDLIMNNTRGKGVNVVLNSLAEDKFQASFRCVAKHGRFLEIGKYDLAMDHSLGLKSFLKNISFHAIFLDEIEKSSSVLKHIMQLLKDGIKSGVVKPLDRTVFQKDETEKAFRYMASGTHKGKILLKIREEEPEKYAIPKILKLPAIPFTYFYDHKVYIIIGGLGGFGIELTKWMLGKGAHNVILTSRYGARTPYHHLCLKRWKDDGFNVTVSTFNVSIKDEAEELLKLASQTGPVGAIFNSAVVLKDSFLEGMNSKSFKEVCDPKAIATQNLDELTRTFCPDLDYFVCFSSISCGRGNAGQTNYGYANSVMERICEQRRSSGLHGLAIQWGIIGEVGVVHRHMGDDAMIAGVCAQSVTSCLDTLELFCQSDYPVVSSYRISKLCAKKSNQEDFLDQVAKMFGLKDVSDFNAYRNFGEMGVDSMIGIEMKHLLESTWDETFTIQQIQEMKIDDLKRMFEENENNQNPKSTGLVNTTSIKLPVPVKHETPVIPLNTVVVGTPIFIVTVEDDDISHIQALGKGIDKPVFALLWTEDQPVGNIGTVAAWYIERMKNVTNNPFHLIGYSSGGNLAFEIVLQSEKFGCNIKTFTLIGSATFLSKAVSREYDDKNLDVTILCEYVEKYIPGSTSKVQKELLEVKTLDERIRIIVNTLANACTETVNKTTLTNTINSYVKRAILLQTFTPESSLAKDIVLLEDSTDLLANDISEVKTLLSKVCCRKIHIHRLPDIKVVSDESVPRITSVLSKVLSQND